MHLQLLFATGLVVGFLYMVIAQTWSYIASPLRKIPGPWSAQFSRLWFFRKVREGSFHHENIALHKQYGPVVRIAPDYVSISTPEKSIYGIGSKFPKGDWYQGWKHPSPDRWTMFPDQDMKRHADTRKRFQALYSMSSLLSYELYVDQCIDILLQRLRESAQYGSTMNLAHWFQCYAFDVIGEITYSERFGFLDKGEDIADTIAALHKSMSYSTLVGIFPKLHQYIYYILEKIPGSGPAGRSYLMNFVQRKIAERSQNGMEKSQAVNVEDESSPSDFLHKLLEAKRQNPEKVTPYHIFMMGLSNIVAGSDTTAVSLSSVIYYLLRTPSALSKLRTEIQEHDLENRRTTFKDSQEMPYLQAVIKEALRMHPATGLPLWRVVPEGGVHVSGQFIPPGTNVGVNSWVAHYDESVYGEDAHIFRPERWEEAKEKDGDLYKRMEANYMPFGLGSRTCIGRHISILEMSKLIPEIIKSFDLTLAMHQDQWKTINYWFVMPEKLPVKVSCRDLISHNEKPQI